MRVEADGGVNAGVVVGDSHRPARACLVDTNGDNAPHPVFRGRPDHRVQIGGEGFHVEVAVGVDQFGARRQGRQCLLGGLHLDLPGDQGDVATVYRYRHGAVPNRSGPTRPDVHHDAWQRCPAGRMLVDITTLFFTTCWSRRCPERQPDRAGGRCYSGGYFRQPWYHQRPGGSGRKRRVRLGFRLAAVARCAHPVSGGRRVVACRRVRSSRSPFTKTGG